MNPCLPDMEIRIARKGNRLAGRGSNKYGFTGKMFVEDQLDPLLVLFRAQEHVFPINGGILFILLLEIFSA